MTEAEVDVDTVDDDADCVALLMTRSDQRMLAPDVRDRLLRGVRDVIERHGDRIHLPYVTVIRLAHHS